MVDYVGEAQAHGEPIVVKDYAVKTLTAMLENWQSEFLHDPQQGEQRIRELDEKFPKA